MLLLHGVPGKWFEGTCAANCRELGNSIDLGVTVGSAGVQRAP